MGTKSTSTRRKLFFKALLQLGGGSGGDNRVVRRMFRPNFFALGSNIFVPKAGQTFFGRLVKATAIFDR